jgi:alpha-ketoglutarate-dependent sulfate ester dioxygenase
MHRITLAGDIPISVTGERSRIIQGDASEYSILDEPHQIVA